MQYRCMRWLDRHSESIHWQPALHRDEETYQCGHVQKVNNAGRREENMWYVVERHNGERPQLCPALYHTAAEAREAAQHKNTRAGYTRWSPLLRRMLAHEPLIQGISVTEAKARGGDVLVQAVVPYTHVVALWKEHDCAQIFNVTTREFYDAGDVALYDAVSRVVQPGWFVYGSVHCADPQRIMLLHNASSPPQDKVATLQALQAACANHQVRVYLSVAPFQVAKTPKEMKLHARIFTEAYAGGVTYHAVG